VKKLATQTATVTSGITDHIKLIRDETGQAQLASTEILDIIENMSETVTQIFETIDAQNETVVEISRNVNEAADEAGNIERGVEAVNQAISGSENDIKNSRDQSEILMGKAEKLQAQVASFLNEVRAG
jgi:methyl-accepting chemotaxis protein